MKKITTGGTFKFQGRLLFIAQSLTDHHIGLEEVDTGIWNIYFNRVLLAKLLSGTTSSGDNSESVTHIAG